MAEPLWTSEEIAAATNGKLAGRPFTATGVSIDTRTIEPPLKCHCLPSQNKTPTKGSLAI